MLTPQKAQQGFGLIEMLVAGLVITIGLIGMLLLQANTQRDAFNAHRLSMAGLYAQDLQERLRANMCHINDVGDNTTDLQSFLNNQKDAWEDHHKLADKGWDLSQLTLEEAEDNDPETTGYWRFDLKACYAQCSSDKPKEMTQRLLVEYREDGC